MESCQKPIRSYQYHNSHQHLMHEEMKTSTFSCSLWNWSFHTSCLSESSWVMWSPSAPAGLQVSSLKINSKYFFKCYYKMRLPLLPLKLIAISYGVWFWLAAVKAVVKHSFSKHLLVLLAIIVLSVLLKNLFNVLYFIFWNHEVYNCFIKSNNPCEAVVYGEFITALHLCIKLKNAVLNCTVPSQDKSKYFNLWI